MSRHPGRVRVIGGQWRRRLIDVPEAPGLRPTPDRVRETLFNWLAPTINGARCLDLFAGSGVLGIEALSRGAAHVEFVDRENAALRGIAAALETFGAEASRYALRRDDAVRAVTGLTGPFDVVFVDPPYDTDLIPSVLAALEGKLSADHYVYLESPNCDTLALPGWGWLRQRRAGQVSYGLVDTRPSTRSPDE